MPFTLPSLLPYREVSYGGTITIYWEIGEGGMGMVAGPEAELVLQRSGVLGRVIFFNLVSSHLIGVQTRPWMLTWN